MAHTYTFDHLTWNSRRVDQKERQPKRKSANSLFNKSDTALLSISSSCLANKLLSVLAFRSLLRKLATCAKPISPPPTFPNRRGPRAFTGLSFSPPALVLRLDSLPQTAALSNGNVSLRVPLLAQSPQIKPCLFSRSFLFGPDYIKPTGNGMSPHVDVIYQAPRSQASPTDLRQ